MAKKVKRRIKVTQRARLVEKNDATRVNRAEGYPAMKPQMPRTNGAVLKVRVKKK